LSPPPSFFLFQDSQATQAQQLHYLKINQSIKQPKNPSINQYVKTTKFANTFKNQTTYLTNHLPSYYYSQEEKSLIKQSGNQSIKSNSLSSTIGGNRETDQ